MDASEEINKQRSLVEKINLVANVIAKRRRSGASYMVSTKYIYDALFPDNKQEKRIKKIFRILNSKI